MLKIGTKKKKKCIVLDVWCKNTFVSWNSFNVK